MTYAAPAPPYVGPPAHSSGTDNKPVHRVVIHCTVGPCALGEARDTAAWFRNPQASGSAHYVVDPAEVVQVAYDSVVAWHAPPNPNSIGVELCDPMDGDGRRWSDEAHHAMLRRAAELVAGLCLAYDVPVRKISAAGLRAGVHGICGHDDVSDAFKESTHWDPGPAFPWPVFMDLVRHHVRRMAKDATPVVVVPVPTPAEQAKPSRVQVARRLLRRALRRTTTGSHKRADSIRAALRELPPR